MREASPVLRVLVLEILLVEFENCRAQISRGFLLKILTDDCDEVLVVALKFAKVWFVRFAVEPSDVGHLLNLLSHQRISIQVLAVNCIGQILIERVDGAVIVDARLVDRLFALRRKGGYRLEQECAKAIVAALLRVGAVGDDDRVLEVVPDMVRMLGEEEETAGRMLMEVARAMVVGGRADEFRENLAECRSEEDGIGEYGKEVLAAVESLLSDPSGD
jgi:hypothetical protein